MTSTGKMKFSSADKCYSILNLQSQEDRKGKPSQIIMIHSNISTDISINKCN